MMHRLDDRTSNSAPLALPVSLVVVDYDTQRFTLEGPIFDIEPWDKEVGRMRRSGRDVRAIPTDMRAVKETTDVLEAKGFDEWPAHSIVDMPQAASTNTGAEHFPNARILSDYAIEGSSADTLTAGERLDRLRMVTPWKHMVRRRRKS
jgi:hypothetical protein